jgi:hypothetical protein
MATSISPKQEAWLKELGALLGEGPTDTGSKTDRMATESDVLAFGKKPATAGAGGAKPAAPAADLNLAQNSSGPSASGDKRGNVGIKYPNGSTETRTGGSLAWRNNNPGNMRAGVEGYPPIGKNAGFAIFLDEATGFAAMVANLNTSRYQALTVGGAINTWAPGSDGNDPAKYAAQVAKWTGLDVNTAMKSLNADQLKSVANAIQRYEGWKPGTVVVTPAAKK